MPRPVADAVAVITGASSGIGRTTALQLAREGATVVLVARREAALNSLAAEIVQAGGKAMAMPLDVTDESAVHRLAETVVDTHGRIDIWINNASVTAFGPFLDIPAADFRRIIDVNILGFVHGTRAVLPIFLQQGSGTLVNVASVNSRVPQPHAIAYVASKHAVRAFSAGLRQELLLQGARNVHVVTVLPAGIDTPLFGHAGNYTGKAVRPPRPVYPPETVADTILDGIRHPRNEIYAGGAGKMANLSMKIAPALTERLATLMDGEITLDDQPMPSTSGNLFTPSAGDARVSGGWLSEGDLQGRNAGKVLGVTVAATAIAAGIARRVRRG